MSETPTFDAIKICWTTSMDDGLDGTTTPSMEPRRPRWNHDDLDGTTTTSIKPRRRVHVEF